MTIYEKARCWIIKKLGGYPNAIEAHPIAHDYKSIPIITIAGQVELPDEIFRTSTPKEDYITRQEIAERIGKYIVDNNLYIAHISYDPVCKYEVMKYVVKVADIQKVNAMECTI